MTTYRFKELSKLAGSGLIEDFSNGTADWSSRNGDSITTYKLQSPMINRSNHKVLAFTIDPQGRDHTLRLRLGSSFLSRENNLGNFTFSTRLSGNGPQKILIDRTDFKSEKGTELEWAKVSTFNVTLVDLKQKKGGRSTLRIQPVIRFSEKIKLLTEANWHIPDSWFLE